MPANMSAKPQGLQHPKSAPPPLLSVLLIGVFVAASLAVLPAIETLDQDASVQMFTNRVFPEAMSVSALAYVRLAIAIFIFALTFHTTFIGKGWSKMTRYMPRSKLKSVKIQITGLKTQFPFTSWSWNLLGVSFGLNAYIAFLAATQNHISPWLLRTALLTFETAVPCALLVSSVVRYVIWPNVLKQGGSAEGLKHPRALLMHNANVILALTELSLLGGPPIYFSHASMAPLFGITYVIFTWCTTKWWAPDIHGPQFFYFFLDTTLGTTTSLALLVLLAVLMIFYALVSFARTVLASLGGGVLVHLLFVALLSAGVCRVND